MMLKVFGIKKMYMQGYKNVLFISFITVLCFSSCVSYKNTLLLQRDNSDTSNTVNLALKYSTVEYKIQEGDFLDVKIQSPDGTSLVFFNKPSTTSGGSQLSEGNLYLNSYIVDLNGKIYLPIIGEVDVRGKTTIEVKKIIVEKLSLYYKISDVSVKMMSFKVTFIGEVKRPSTVFIYNMNTTMFEGLSKVGGATDFTNTHKVTVVRKFSNVNAKADKVNINTIKFVESEFYYLRPGDIVYLEPIRYKTFTKNIPLVSFVFSVTSFMITIWALTKR